MLSEEVPPRQGSRCVSSPWKGRGTPKTIEGSMAPGPPGLLGRPRALPGSRLYCPRPHWRRPLSPELRASPYGAASLGQREIIGHYERLIRTLAEPPILIGHRRAGYSSSICSTGPRRAGVAIDPAPTPGVPLFPRYRVGAAGVSRSLQLAEGHICRGAFSIAVRPVGAQGRGRCALRPLHHTNPGKVCWDGVINKITD